MRATTGTAGRRGVYAPIDETVCPHPSPLYLCTCPTRSHGALQTVTPWSGVQSAAPVAIAFLHWPSWSQRAQGGCDGAQTGAAVTPLQTSSLPSPLAQRLADAVGSARRLLKWPWRGEEPASASWPSRWVVEACWGPLPRKEPPRQRSHPPPSRHSEGRGKRGERAFCCGKCGGQVSHPGTSTTNLCVNNAKQANKQKLNTKEKEMCKDERGGREVEREKEKCLEALHLHVGYSKR